MAAIVFGIIFLVIAVIVFLVQTLSTKKHLEQLTSSGRQKLGEILGAYRETKKELGEMGEENTVSEKLTVMGNPSCDEPLTSPLGQKPCVYYEVKVTANRVERYQERDSNGNMQNRTRNVTDTLDHSTNSTRFKLDDGTDTVIVDPRDGQFDGLVTTVDRSEVHQPGAGPTLSFGGFSLTLPNASSLANQPPQTIHYEEKIIGLDRKLTVVGTLCDKMGELLIEKSGKTKVIVSTKSPDEMLAETESAMKRQRIIMIACGAIGLILLIVGIVT